MSSINGEYGTQDSLFYNLSKASINNAVKSLCVDLANEGINVNGIAPGFIKTRMSVLADGSDEFEDENFQNIYIKNKKFLWGAMVNLRIFLKLFYFYRALSQIISMVR